MRVVLLCWWSLTACSGLLGIEDVSLGAKTGPGSDAGGDRTPSTVHGTANTLHYVSPSDTATVPLDVSGYVFQAYAPDDSDAGFRIINGVGTRDGTFTIPDVRAARTTCSRSRRAAQSCTSSRRRRARPRSGAA
jgi:hypothetical protein